MMEPVQSQPQGFTGTVSLPLPDLIQMVCLSRSDLTVRVSSGHGEGMIYVRNGQVEHAQADPLVGEAAFFEMLRWQDGRFEMLSYESPPSESIQSSWEHLLLEAMRRRDDEKDAPCQDAGGWDSLQGGSEPLPLEEETDDLDHNLDRLFDGLESLSQQYAEEIQREIALEAEDEKKNEPVEPLRVLIVEDSIFFARQLQRLIEADPLMKVAAIARNGQKALEYLASNTTVDVITLDIQMPVMPGDTALKHIMIRHPIPVLILSAIRPDSLGKIFDFLQVGAIDFMSKPQAQSNTETYGEGLRDLLRKVARADVSRFRRIRKSRRPSFPAISPKLAEGCTGSNGVLVVFGGEGAYMDWFRLPLARLSADRLLFGLQKLPEMFLPGFCRLLEEWTAVRVAPLVDESACIEPIPGTLYLGNAMRRARLMGSLDPLSLNVETSDEESLSWPEGAKLWLSQLSELFQDRLTVLLLSGAQSLSPDLIDNLMEHRSRLLLSLPEAIMCADMVEGIRPRALLHPDLVVCHHPESVLEVL